MKNWKQVKEVYIKDHLAKELTDHNIRLNALKKIERVFAERFPLPLGGDEVFRNISKPYFIKLYECLKGAPLNGAEKSVINGLYKFSV